MFNVNIIQIFILKTKSNISNSNSMLMTTKSANTDMGAIDPIVSRNHVKLKSASIEATSNQPNNRSTRSQYDYDDTSSLEPEVNHQLRTNSFHHKARKFLTLSPGSLKPSVSTSCLLTTEESNPSNALVCIPTRASLTHEWKKLKTPNKCRECNLLVYFNGRECSFCGFVAHKKCVTILVIKCSGQQVAETSKNKKDRQSKLIVNQDNPQQSSRKIKSSIQPIFGQPIDIESRQVVDFIRRFIYEIDTRGLTSKGIYRVSSIKSKVDRLCNYYDQNISSLVDLSSFHPNIIANALKMYLRQLPEPLLTHELYNMFIELGKKYSNSSSSRSSKISNKHTQVSSMFSRHWKPYSLAISSTTTANINNDPSYDPMLIVELKEVIELLPKINRDLIAIIMRHLKRVADMSNENQMSAKNLSIIFGPTLLSADNKSLAIVDNIHQARVVELIITWADQVFPQYENYESKAVMELNYSQEQLEAEPQNKSLKTKLTRDNKEKKVNRNAERQSKTKEGRKLKNESEIKEIDSSQPRKTRQDLQELRRQFFKLPNEQDNLVLSGTDSRAPLCDKIEQGLKELTSYNPSGSVPVIKVQPYYCTKLPNNAENKSKMVSATSLH